MYFTNKPPSPLMDLITGLGGAFGKPQMDNTGFVAKTPKQPKDPNVMIFLPDKSEEDQKTWNQTWGIERSPDVPDLPAYPFEAGQNIGNQIRRAWHDTHKDYAYNTVQQKFPDFTAPQPQPDQSYHQYIASMLQPAMQQENVFLPIAREGRSGGFRTADYDRERDGIGKDVLLADNSFGNPYPVPPALIPGNDYPGGVMRPEQSETYGPKMPESPEKILPQTIPFDPRKISPTPQAKTLEWAVDAAQMLGGPIVSRLIDNVGGTVVNKITEQEYQQHMKNIDDLIKINKDSGNNRDAEILEQIRKIDIKNRDDNRSGNPTPPGSQYLNDQKRGQLLDMLESGRSKPPKR